MNPTAEPDGLMMAHPGPEGDSISDGPVADGTGGPGRYRPTRRLVLRLLIEVAASLSDVADVALVVAVRVL